MLKFTFCVAECSCVMLILNTLFYDVMLCCFQRGFSRGLDNRTKNAVMDYDINPEMDWVEHVDQPNPCGLSSRLGFFSLQSNKP